MIELKKEFETKKYNMHHQQIYKDNELVIYEVSQPSFEKIDEISKWYEIFEYRVNARDKYHNDEWEHYPKTDEYFGKWAWSCSNEASLKKILKKHFPSHKLNFDLSVMVSRN